MFGSYQFAFAFRETPTICRFQMRNRFDFPKINVITANVYRINAAKTKLVLVVDKYNPEEKIAKISGEKQISIFIEVITLY